MCCSSLLQWSLLFLIVVLSGTYAEACGAQDAFSDDSHWDPQFGPPALFLNPYNVETTDAYVIVSGQKYEPDRVEVTYGTVYRAARSKEIPNLNIPGWEDATIMAGDTRIYARRGPGNEEIAELDLNAGKADLIPHPPGSSHRFTTFGDTLYAVSSTEGDVHRWSGTVWETLGPPLDLSVDEWIVGVSGVFVAVGPGTICDPQNSNTTLWHLDGGSWTQIGLAKGIGNPPVSGLAVDSRGRFMIAGDFIAVDEVATQRVARWDGMRWSALGSGLGPEMGFITNLLAVDTLIYAAGDLVLEWDGSRWSALGAGLSGTVRALATRGSTLYAGGEMTCADDVTACGLAIWEEEAAAWHYLEADAEGRRLTKATSLALSEGLLYAGGTLQEKGGDQEAGVFMWDGQRWTVLGAALYDGDRSGFIYSVTLGDDGSVYAGGFFDTIGGTPAENIARWDGTRWTALGDGLPDEVLALDVEGERLYAGVRRYSDTLGRAALHIWDGAAVTWTAVEGGIKADPSCMEAIYAIVARPEGVYVGGGSGVCAVKREAESSVQGIARWNGTAWEHLGSGIAGRVHALALQGDDLYAGGGFDTAGGHPSLSFAHWNERLVLPVEQEPVPAGFRLEPNYPNPFSLATTLAYTLPHPVSEVTLTVFDLLGREVVTVTDVPQHAGQHRVPLTMKDLPNGVYLYQLRAGDLTITRQMLLAK